MADDFYETMAKIIETSTLPSKYKAVIISEFGEVNIDKHRLIGKALDKIFESYSIGTVSTEESEARRRAKYSALSSSARRLILLLQKHRYEYFNLYFGSRARGLNTEEDHAGTRPIPDFRVLKQQMEISRAIEQDWKTFNAILERLEDEARSMLEGSARLEQQMREVSRRGNKSKERFYIWEPVFELWEICGRKVGYSLRGPLFRIINTMHTGLKIAPPSPDSVHQAIRDFRKGK